MDQVDIGSNKKLISFSLDVRVDMEALIIAEIEKTIPGRKAKYLRDLMVAGYIALHGERNRVSMFDAERPVIVADATQKIQPKPRKEKLIVQQSEPAIEQVPVEKAVVKEIKPQQEAQVEQKPLEEKKSGGLFALMGDQL